MSGVSVIFYKGGILVCDANPLIRQALDRLSVSILSGESSAIIVNVAKNSTPEIIGAYETYQDADLVLGLANASTEQDWNEFAKEAIAAGFGIAVGVISSPSGPVYAVAAGEFASWLYKEAYDSAGNLGKSLNWGIWLADLLHPAPEMTNIDPFANDAYLRSRAWILPVDPLVLDLDGDGIETVGINGYDTVLFDHDGDGIKTGTGWVKGDDGFLVLDRNGNGQIDNGSELFGVDTVKSNGQKATSGLDALADLDSNGDGVFDQDDAQFANVRIWQDKDQDGIADADEITTLAEQGIVAIDLNGATANKNLGNGNSQTQTAAFTREDGSTGEAGSIELAENPFYREFEDSISLSTATAQLPDMQGSGAVRDLREAAQGAPELAAQLKALQDAGLMDREAYQMRIEAANDEAFWCDHAMKRSVA